MAESSGMPHQWKTDFYKLQVLLQKAIAGTPVFVAVSAEDQPVEDELIYLLRQQFSTVHIADFGFERYGSGLRDYLLHYMPYGTQIVLARGLDRLPDLARQQALQILNCERDVVGQFGCSLVVFFTPEIVHEFPRWAADFWDCSSAYLEFRDPERQRVKAQILETRRVYLRRMQEQCAVVELRGISPAVGSPQVDLAAVFVEPSVKVGRESSLDSRSPSIEPETLLFRKLLKPRQRMVILGAPGAGKSVLLRYIATLLAQGPTVVGRYVGANVEIDWFPILLPLSAYAAALADSFDLTLSDYLPAYLSSREWGDLEFLTPLVHDELQNGRGVVMLDGLDEIASIEQRHEVVVRIRDFIRRFPENIYLITSRIAGYDRAAISEEFGLLTIVDLEWSQRQKLVHKWCAAVLHPTTETGDAKTAAELEAKRLAEGLLAIIEREDYLDALSSSPLLLTILTNIYLQGKSLPTRRGELYRIATAVLTETWSLERSISGRPVRVRLDEQILDERRVVELLSPLAFWMHQTRPNGVVTHHEMVRHLADYMEQREGMQEERAWRVAEEFAALVQEKVGLLVERQPGEFAFVHRTFQEYLAARYLSMRRNVNEQAVRLLPDANWEEVLALVGDVLQGEWFDDYVYALLSANLEDSAVGQNIILAGRCLYSAGVHLTGTVLGQRVMEALVTLVETAIMPFSRRLDAGEVLGNLGDPRVTQMIEIPAGPFTMGLSAEELARYAEPGPLRRLLERCAPAHEVYVPAFYLDRHPVTHAQYARFMEDHGYERPELWTPEGWEWFLQVSRKMPAYWEEYRWNRPNYPVIGVSWYEADAYAHWAGKRLPTEAEYEKAARGTDLRTWPWGNEWLDDVANAEAKLGQLTPIGIYPKGVSPYGVMDMAGNAWEWTADWFMPYESPEQQDTHSKVLRGGAWNSDREQLRCVVRLMSEPSERVGSVGFRCASDEEGG
ncbi:MAG: SUMF1/EgtB/PvdO family nonheme iron enzyme [Anaerolineae bacterium]|nr:SUMF1/EgtB/PvdO family nonheme iron enzyme [Anaerolineae bacterium]